MQKDSFEIWSPQLRNRRGVDVYLPESYGQGRRRYPVVYMQDGQNLSDPSIAFCGNTWRLRRRTARGWPSAASSRSSSASTTPSARLAEYSPFEDAQHGGGDGDRYARFLIDTVKPRIDAHYRTRKDRASTVIAGSSMGGLISLYAFFRRPSAFGAAAVLSPSIWFGGREILSFVQQARLTRGRIYLDVGTNEGPATLRDARTLNRVLRRKGYKERCALVSRGAGRPAPGSRLGLAAAASAGVSASRAVVFPSVDAVTADREGVAAQQEHVLSNGAFWIALAAAVWLAATVLCWVGYTGEDDLFYARYAFLLHRPPIVWWEFRMPAILAIRSSFLLFGPSEFAAALPSLVSSAAMAASVAWFVDWPRKLTWQSQAAMLLVAVIPIDAGFRSYPSANPLAAGLLVAGTVSMLKGARRTQILGSALLALGFLAHEISFFYIAIFCVIALLFDVRRFWRPVSWCVALSAALFLGECLAYQLWLGDAFARFRTAAGTTRDTPGGGRRRRRAAGAALLRVAAPEPHPGQKLRVRLAGAARHRHSGVGAVSPASNGSCFTTTFAVYFWLGYGSQVPWTYKPLYRQAHYYQCLSLGVAALLPYTVSLALTGRTRIAQSVVGLALAVHVISLAMTGGWGAGVDVSRELLAYARQHPQERFVTDVNTMNEMYVLGGFRLPENVVCLNGNAVTKRLLVNKEPAGVPRYRFPEGR